MKKQDYYIAGLIGAAAVVVLYLLYRESQNTTQAPASADGTNDLVDAATAQPPYPNVAPIQLGNVTIGSTPPNQNYNVASDQVPTLQVGGAGDSGCGCEDNDCEQAGQVVSTQTIPQAVLQSGIDNLASFQGKVVSGVEAARVVKKQAVSFSQSTPNAAPVNNQPAGGATLAA
jgi:hypothetical protein